MPTDTQESAETLNQGQGSFGHVGEAEIVEGACLIESQTPEGQTGKCRLGGARLRSSLFPFPSLTTQSEGVLVFLGATSACVA